jgi:hypothetical protein
MYLQRLKSTKIPYLLYTWNPSYSTHEKMQIRFDEKNEDIGDALVIHEWNYPLRHKGQDIS